MQKVSSYELGLFRRPSLPLLFDWIFAFHKISIMSYRSTGPTLINLPPPPSDSGRGTPSDFGPYASLQPISCTLMTLKKLLTPAVEPPTPPSQPPQSKTAIKVRHIITTATMHTTLPPPPTALQILSTPSALTVSPASPASNV